MIYLSETDYRVLRALSEQPGPTTIEEIAEITQLDQAQVSAACISRADAGEIQLDERRWAELRLGNKGKPYAERPLPERVVIEALSKAGGSAELGQLPQISGLEQKEVGQSLRWLQQKGWARKDGQTVTLQPDGSRALEEAPGPDEQLVATLGQLGSATEQQLQERGVDMQRARGLLAGRKGLIDERERKTRLVSLTERGRQLVTSGIEPRRQVTQLTSELLRSGAWREVELRPYDVTLEGQHAHPGKEHPLVSVFQKTRRVFLELGFSEVDSPYVESGFWDFDALFSPQDHPARDMQDTFYIERPARCALPPDELVDTVARTHQDGGDTGSVGWRYSWDRELARRPLLRTHTTAATIRAIADNPRPPRKVFCVGPVFRRETVDYKHLPVFHQVEGIIVDEQGSFASLLGTLELFYRKMGFSRFQFRPGFFPYTEPSVEVFVWLDSKKDWVEMGGAGVFRPEVTLPLGCEAPVLAWGLGLERLAMFKYQLSSIVELYRARLGWLKETPLCR